jgi:uncharacterized membrane protein YobD (UPF0266 family)
MKLVFDSIKKDSTILYSYVWFRYPKLEKMVIRYSEDSLAIFKIDNPTNIQFFNTNDNSQIVISKDEKEIVIS